MGNLVDGSIATPTAYRNTNMVTTPMHCSAASVVLVGGGVGSSSNATNLMLGSVSVDVCTTHIVRCYSNTASGHVGGATEGAH